MLTFPTHLFNPSRIKITPVSSTITGGEALDGSADVIRTDGGGRWQVNLMGIELYNADLVRAWRAWEDELDGGVMRVKVPIADVNNAPRPVIGGKLGFPSEIAAGSLDPYFPEAVGFAQPWIEAKLAVAAVVRSTILQINVVRGARLKGGEYLSIDHAGVGRRLYRCGRVLSTNGQTATVKIRPPLREAALIDTATDFDWPSVSATLLPSSDISIELLYGRTGTIDITFLEAR